MNAGLFLEFPAGRGQDVFPLLRHAFGNRPRPRVTLEPEGAARVSQKDLEPARRAAVQQQSSAGGGGPSHQADILPAGPQGAEVAGRIGQYPIGTGFAS